MRAVTSLLMSSNHLPCISAGRASELELGLLYAEAVDGLEVVVHGNDMIASLDPLGTQLEGLFTVGMVALLVVGYQHEGCRLVERVAEAVVVHGTVAAAVAKREHGHLANLLADLQHLVGLQVLDDELVGAHQVFFTTHGVVDTGLGALAGGAQLHVHAYHAVGGDAERLDQRTADVYARPAGTRAQNGTENARTAANGTLLKKRNIPLPSDKARAVFLLSGRRHLFRMISYGSSRR